MSKTICASLCLVACFSLKAQYNFTGAVDKNEWKDGVYLSVIEDYRKISGVFPEQIICKIKTDASGYFEFQGDQLELKNRLYRIHVDNCTEDGQNMNHFNGHCLNSKTIVFIAKNTDSIALPFSFDKQMFCDFQSSNPRANAISRIDSLKEDMKYAFGEFRSEANRKLNSKKWFKTLQDFGEGLNEPLAELYIYSFLSDRTSDLHDFYLEDLKVNPYYEELLIRLENQYPDSPYVKQYKTELKSDQFIISPQKEASLTWHYILGIILLFSLLTNFYFIFKFKKSKHTNLSNKKEKLTNQEEKALQLLLTNQTNKVIADSLFVSVSTIKSHINNIYKKLNVASRDEVKKLFHS